MYTYFHPITVRYRDLDPQGHVNNATLLTYFESARLGYYQQVGIYKPGTGQLTGLVVAHVEIDYLAPIIFGQDVQVATRVERLGNKSVTFVFQVESVPGGAPLARGISVMVTYDNEKQTSIPIHPEWREKITAFEAQKGHPL
jgi:acyl-CoA thioester hydrolase